MMSRFSVLLALLVALVSITQLHAAPFLSSNDFIIAIDTDDPILPSDYPGAEAPLNALDGDSGSKYLNFATVNTGFIVQPFIGSTTVQSIQLTTANDAVERDPLSWELYGTSDPLASADNGDGSAENWTLIASADANLPEERETAGPVQSFANSTAYSAYRVLFPTVKDANAANSMQIADVGLFESNDGSGLSVWDEFELDVVAFAFSQPDSRYPGAEGPMAILDGNGPNTTLPSQSGYFDGEGPASVVDGTLAKYLNFGDMDSGFIVTPASGPSQVQSFQLTTANDAVGRDPTSWALYGTNETIVSEDNSFGTAENWTLLDSGAIALPADRDTLGPVVTVNNSSTYNSYKMIFPDVVDVPGDLMQIAEASFFTSTDGSGSDILNPGDTILAVDESPRFNSETKYLNFGGENSGFIITPEAGSKVITGFQITTANDFEDRDPASYELYGTNDAIVSEDNSQGDGENWTLISSGDLSLPGERLTEDEIISFANAAAYTSYRMVFPSLKDPGENNDNSMQIATIEFFDDSVAADVDLDDDGDVDGVDFLLIQRMDPSLIPDWQLQYGTMAVSAGTAAVPEPASAWTLVLGVMLASLVTHRRSHHSSECRRIA